MAEQAHQARPDAPVEIVWQPQKGPQHAFVTCPIFEVFYGGARGGGKTDGFLGEFARHAGRYGGDAIGLAIRRERTQLIETIERSRAMYTQIGAVFHEQEKMWRFPNGARLRFAYLERDSDAEAYQGHSYTRVYVEEITNFPDPKPLLKLMATLRSGAGVPCGFRATGNPGGPGHHWVKQRYIDPAPNGMQPIKETFKNPWSGEVVERERIYIPARVTDNKFLGTDYVANLQMAGSAQLVRAWLSGDWSVIEGAFFDTWSSHRHVCEPFEIPAHYKRLYAMDPGWNCTAALFMALDPETDTAYIYAEYCGIEKEPTINAERIKSLNKGWIPGVVDPASHVRTQDAGKKLLSMYRALGLKLREARNDVEVGIDMVYDRLSTGRLKIFRNLFEFRREYSAYRRINGHIVKEKDHLMDCMRYLILNINYAKSRSSVEFNPFANSDTEYRRNEGGGRNYAI